MNIPRTLDNMREFDPSMLTANPAGTHPSASTSASQPSAATHTGSLSHGPDPESLHDLASDPFAGYFDPPSDYDPSKPPKVLITTSPKATKVSYNFCEELVGIFPGAEFIRRKKGSGFEIGRIASWAGKRNYGAMIVVNEDSKKPS